jgi:hypothetical protein
MGDEFLFAGRVAFLEDDPRLEGFLAFSFRMGDASDADL